MENFVQWVLALPLHIWIPLYLLVGIVVGINYRFFFARHMWVKHQSETRPETGNCWCKDSTSHPFISSGDWVAIGVWTAPVLWPIHLPFALLVMSIITYGKALRGIHSFAQGGAKRMFEHLKTECELRVALERAGDTIQARERTINDYKKALEACQKEFDLARSENARLKAEAAPKPADVRVDELLDRSAKLLDKVNAREPGAVSEDPFRCTACGRKFDKPFESHICKRV